MDYAKGLTIDCFTRRIMIYKLLCYDRRNLQPSMTIQAAMIESFEHSPYDYSWCLLSIGKEEIESYISMLQNAGRHTNITLL